MRRLYRLACGLYSGPVRLEDMCLALLCVELACAFFLERARLRGVLTARCIHPLLLQPVRLSVRIRVGRYPAKHVPAARSNGAAPFFCPAQQLISGSFFRGYLLYTAHPILCRLLQLFFLFFFGGPQTFFGQFFWSVAERFGQLCSVTAFSCFDVPPYPICRTEKQSV